MKYIEMFDKIHWREATKQNNAGTRQKCCIAKDCLGTQPEYTKPKQQKNGEVGQKFQVKNTTDEVFQRFSQ